MSRTPEMRRERRVLFPTNAVLREVQAKWYFTDEELWRTPSILDGMSMEEEHTLRSKGVYFIIQVGVVLRLSQFTIYTASVFLHRFFMRFSMKDIPNRPGMHPYPVAATSVFLASKVDENCRKMREFVIACCRVAMKNPHMLVDEQTKDFWKWRDTLLHNEDLMLEALCFDVQLELPYRFLEKFVHYFNIQDKTVRNSAWAFINDSLYTIVYVQFQARTVAAAALYAAARQYNYAIEDDPEGRPWWEHLSLSLAKLRRVCNRMADVYEMIAVPHSKRQYLHLAPHDEEDNDKTRKPGKNGQVRPPSESNGKKRGHDQGQVGPPSDENGTTKRRKLGEQPPSSPQSSAPHPLSSSNGTGLESPPLPPAVKAGTVPPPPQSQTSHNPSHSPTQTRPPPPLPSSSTSSYSSSRIPPPPPPPLDPASGSTYQPPPPPPPPGALDTPTRPGPSSQPPLRVEAATAAEVQRRIDSIVQHSSGSREPVAPGSSRRPPYAPRPPPRETYRSPVSERAPHGEQDRTREWGRDSARDRYGSEDSGHEWRARHHWDHRTHHRDRDHREHRDHHERAHWSHQRDREYHDRDDRSRDYHDRHHNCDRDHSDRSLWRGGNHKDSDHYSSNHSRSRDGHSGSRGSGNRPDSGHRYEHEHEHE